MFWYPFTATIPLTLVWPSGVASTSLSLAALIAAGRLAVLALRAARTRTVAGDPSMPLDEELEVENAAA